MAEFSNVHQISSGSPSSSGNTAECEETRILQLISGLFEYSRAIPAVAVVFDGITLPEENGASLRSILESITSGDRELSPTIHGLDKAIANALATLTAQNLHPPPNARKRPRADFEANHELERARVNGKDIETVINAALKALQNNIIDPALLTTLQLRLHTLFVSSITALTPSTPARVRDTLGKMSKLIQLLGVLSGLQLPVIPVPQQATSTVYGGPPYADQPLGTEVPPRRTQTTHPCPHPTCLKTFSKAYDLRVHSRVHVNHRPFACPTCPATFTRNHDLQRHARSHPYHGVAEDSAGVHAVRCTVCSRTFSRRDAFVRHTRGGRGKRKPEGRSQCAAALGETIMNLPSPVRKRKTTEHGEEPNQGSESSVSLDHPDLTDPFSIFSEMDFAQMDMDLSQLLGLPQLAVEL